MAVILTDEQKVDVRRFCGYPALGDGSLSPFFWRMFPDSDTLESRLNQIGFHEAAILDNYICQLKTLEAAVFNAGANLDVLQVATVTMNPRELSQRTAMFQMWRRKLCGFLGVATGPDLDACGNSVAWRV